MKKSSAVTIRKLKAKKKQRAKGNLMTIKLIIIVTPIIKLI